MCVFERLPKAAAVDYPLNCVVKEELGGGQVSSGRTGGGKGGEARTRAGAQHLLRAPAERLLPIRTPADRGSERAKIERRCGI